MARPITWQNVQGPDSSAGFRAIEAAGRSINAGFDQFGGLIKEAQAVDGANWEQVKKNNTQEFLNKLYSAAGPEQFKALQDSGELQNMIASNGAQIDQAAARAAMDGRLATLQQRSVEGIKYKNTLADQANVELDRSEQGQRDKVTYLLSRPDKASQAQAAEEILRLSARGQALFGVKQDARQDELVTRDQRNVTFDRQGVRQVAELADMTERQKIARGQLAVSQTNAATSQGQLAVAQAGERRNNLSTVANLQIAANEALAKTGSNDPRTTQGSKALFDGLAGAIKNPDEFAAVRTLVGKALQDPKYSSLSTGDLIAAATSLKNVSSWWRGDNEGTFKKVLDKLAAQPKAGNWREAEDTARAGTSLQLQDLNKANEQTLRAFLTGVGGGSGAGLPGAGGVPPASGRSGSARVLDPNSPTGSSTYVPPPSGSQIQPGRVVQSPGIPRDAAMANLVRLEQEEIRAGVRKNHSTEVEDFKKKIRKEEGAAKRERIKSGLETVARGADNLSAAYLDLFTMPVRGVGAAVQGGNNFWRDMLGAETTAPISGTDTLVPFTEALEANRKGKLPAAQLAEWRRAAEAALREAK